MLAGRPTLPLLCASGTTQCLVTSPRSTSRVDAVLSPTCSATRATRTVPASRRAVMTARSFHWRTDDGSALDG